ncbi:MAG TPA: D-glycero-beta-D-manno-heptose-7-phosphate kinase, partial [Candidatus Paceibacterota bacterium]|nr:D-glycero-beta-D-manno-heptose-7-phosphate kinase [Candidatus Paceibacterota bacterium]
LMRAVGATFAEAAIIANAAAGIVVSKVGTATCSPEELLAQFVK